MSKGDKLKIYKYIILLIPAFFIFLFQGCSAPGYSILHGPLKTGEQHALLFIAEHNLRNTVIGIRQIDTRLLSNTDFISKTKFRLIPGRHRISYSFFMQTSGTIISSEDFNISFSAEPGHTYTLKNYTRWGNDYPERYRPVDFLTMITDTTEGKVAAWESRGTGAFKKEVQGQTGLKFTEAAEIKAGKTDDPAENKEEAWAVCGNDYCEEDENHSSCPADCLPGDTNPTDLKKGDKAVFLDFVYRGQKSGIYFVVNRGVHEKLASLPRSLSYKKGEKKITKKDFILLKLNNPLQRENLLPLVDKIKSLTTDINKQARIAISLVQNIPYTDVANLEKYPYGVLWEHGGACSEKADLLLFLLRELGFGTATLIYKKEDHRAVGIRCPDAYDVGDSGYCYVEVSSPKIITDNLSSYTGVGTLTDFTVIKISDGIQLEGVEEEFRDKNLYYNLVERAKADNGILGQKEYDIYNSLLNKYGME